jgi:50S ribosomal protein L16 3-hydroxylase
LKLTTITVLGGISPAEFLQDYWQKKPLLVRGAMPELIGMFEPQDMLDLALEEGVTARLLMQLGQQHDRWQLKTSPLTRKDFKKLPLYWTLLVQAVDHWSLELAELWHKFNFIPQWRRDDIMVSYAPKGGSVGQHFDQYDVFLVQAHGHRRWQLGQSFPADTAFVPNQPLRLLPDMGEIIFDEILAPGDLLYVPPGLSHYGVAEDDCLTCSFGFRMPNTAQLIERIADQCMGDAALQVPIPDRAALAGQAQAGLVSAQALDDLKQRLLGVLNDPVLFEQAAMALLSEPKYPDSLPDVEPIEMDDWADYLAQGITGRLDPSVRLVYSPNQQFWLNGEMIEVDPAHQTTLQKLADGAWLSTEQLAALPASVVLDWIERSLLMVQLPE